MLANAKREKNNSKFIFTEGMIKRDINVGIRRFVVRNDMRDNIVEERIRLKRRVIKEPFKSSSSRSRRNEREITFQFFNDIRSNNRFRRNHTEDNRRNDFKMRFRDIRNILKKIG